MLYTKHTWVTGEVVTAGNLNNIEDGIANMDYDVIIKLDRVINDYPSDDYIHLVKGTWSDIYTKINNNQPVNAYVYATSGGNGSAGSIVSYITTVNGWVNYGDHLAILVYEAFPETSSSNICTVCVYRFVLTESGLELMRPSNDDVPSVA